MGDAFSVSFILSWQRLIGIFGGPFCMHGEIGITTRFYRILDKCAACFRYIPTTFYTKISALFQGWRDIFRRSILQAYPKVSVTYKTLHGLAPACIKDLLQSYLPARDLIALKIYLLAVPAFNISSYGRLAFSVAAPLLWNSLPQHIRDAGSLGILYTFFWLLIRLWCFYTLQYFMFSFCSLLSGFLNF